MDSPITATASSDVAIPLHDISQTPPLDHISDKCSVSTQSARISNARRYLLFAIFCTANALDSYNLNALFAGLPALKDAFELDEVDASWVMSAFNLTYASFLLISGRISDVYHPKPAFVVGVFALGILSLGAGFVQNKIGLIVIRAFCGICAALSIPSSLALIVRFFPEPHEQALAIALFGGVGALGNVFGTMISAIFVEFADYRWIFWLTAIVGVPAALVCIALIPSREDEQQTAGTVDGKPSSRLTNLRKLDLVGVTSLTVAMILFIFAITSGSGSGWGSAQVIAPLIISIFLVVAFFFWEARIPAENAAVPPRTWFLPNFSVLFGAAVLPYFWWSTVFVILFPLWQQVYGWSAIRSGLQMIPVGISATLISFTSPLGRYLPRKVLILTGTTLAAVATVLLVFGDAPDKYWRFTFPGIIIGSAGIMMAYMHVSIAIFETAPPAMAGVVGAMFNFALQLGAALGLSIDTSIESSIEARPGSGGFEGFKGRRATLWWLFAAVCVETVTILVFFHERRLQSVEDAVEKVCERKVEGDLGVKGGCETLQEEVVV